MITPFIAILIIVSVITLMAFYRKPGKKVQLPDGYKNLLTEHVTFYRNLDAENKMRFEKRLEEFLGYIQITGVQTEVNDLDKLLVASSGVIPIFGFAKWRYYNLSEVLLYHDRFNADNYSSSGKGRDILGMVGSGAMQMQMILSKPDLYKGFGLAAGKENTGIHEFVHLLDKEDGAVDGMPDALLDRQFSIPWLHLMADSITAMKAGKSDINIYGAANHAEFFAVASEYFFEKPALFKQKHPDLYEMLANIFKQKP